MDHAKDISSKQLLEAPLFTVVEDTVQLSTGNTITYKNVLRKPTIDVFPITDTYDIYLIKQYRQLYKRVILEAIAGFIEDGETPEEAAKRELQEESGIQARELTEIGQLYLSGSVIKAQAYIYLAKGLDIGKATPEEDEEIEVVKMSLDEAVTQVLTGEIITSVTAAGILMIASLRQQAKI